MLLEDDDVRAGAPESDRRAQSGWTGPDDERIRHGPASPRTGSREMDLRAVPQIAEAESVRQGRAVRPRVKARRTDSGPSWRTIAFPATADRNPTARSEAGDRRRSPRMTPRVARRSRASRASPVRAGGTW